MRIGFLGNTNNYPFMLALAMRRLGHDVQFFVDQGRLGSHDLLHRPEGRYPDVMPPYPDWIHDVSQMRVRHYVLPNAQRRRIVDVLRSCDAVVLNGFGPALLPLIRRPALAILTGSDLLSYASHAMQRASNVNILRRLAFHALVYMQRRGIRMAKGVSFFWRGLIPDGDTLLDGLGIGDDRRFFLLMTDLNWISRSPLPFNSPPRVFCLCRFVWKKPMRPELSPLDYKGSDIMIRGIGLFYRRTGIRLDIHFVRKGQDLRETVELVEREEIAGLVTWHEEMTQQQIMEQYRLADIVFDQMGGDSMIGMGAMDALAVGRPLIANGRPEILESIAGEPSPICQAATPEQVCLQLERLTSSREELERVANAGRGYVQRCFSSDHAAQLCIDRLVMPA